MPTSCVASSLRQGATLSSQGVATASGDPVQPRGLSAALAIEAAFCRLKDFPRVATRYDKLATNYLSSGTIAAISAFWI